MFHEAYYTDIILYQILNNGHIKVVSCSRVVARLSFTQSKDSADGSNTVTKYPGQGSMAFCIPLALSTWGSTSLPLVIPLS